VSLTDYYALSPLLILLATSLLILIFDSFSKHVTVLTLAGIAIALYAAAICPVSTSSLLTPWLTFDALSRFFALFFLSVGFATVLLSIPFLERFQPSRGEYLFLLTSSLFGLLLISYSNDFLTFFLGLETLSIALYVLCGYMKKWAISNEASVKYFLLGSISTSFLLFGIALLYGATGSTSFDSLAHPQNQMLFLSGIGLITLSVLFKAAIVPLHIWAPDVYAGAPTPITGFMAVATKAGAFVILIRLFLQMYRQVDPIWNEMISLFAYATLIYANFLAIRQTQLRRFFAYSGISHAGFLLIPLAAATPDSASAMLFYLVVYTAATLGSFGILAVIDSKMEGVTFQDLKGLFHRSPLLASIFTLFLLTLGGVPPTVGFFAKFYLFKVAFSAGNVGLVIVGLLTTILSAYYYLRIAQVMFDKSSENQEVSHSLPSAAVYTFSSFMILLITCYPAPFLALFTAVCE